MQESKTSKVFNRSKGNSEEQVDGDKCQAPMSIKVFFSGSSHLLSGSDCRIETVKDIISFPNSVKISSTM